MNPDTAGTQGEPPRAGSPSEPACARHQPVDDVPLGRLEDQIAWYSRRSASDQRWFRILKGVQLVAAAAVPVAATLDAPGVVTGTLGAAIVVIEGFQQLNQHQQNWAPALR